MWVVQHARLCLVGGLACWMQPIHAAQQLAGGNGGTNLAGSFVTIPFSFTGATNVVALQFDVVFDGSSLTSGSASAGAAVGARAFSSTVLTNGALRVVLYSPTNGFLQSGVIANAPLGISPLALQGTTGLLITNALLSDITGQSITPVTLTPGSLYISTALPAQLGTVLRSVNGQVQFRVTGGNQRQYVIQGSTNLINWISIGTNMTAAGLLNFTDLDATNHTVRFYRSLLGP